MSLKFDQFIEIQYLSYYRNLRSSVVHTKNLDVISRLLIREKLFRSESKEKHKNLLDIA